MDLNGLYSTATTPHENIEFTIVEILKPLFVITGVFCILFQNIVRRYYNKLAR